MEVWDKALEAIYILKSGCTIQTLITFDIGKLRLARLDTSRRWSYWKVDMNGTVLSCSR